MNHRLLSWTMLAGLVVAAGACTKPKAEDCEKAVANIRNLYGTATLTQGITPRAAVRSCRGSATRESVQCVIAAKSLEELEACTGGGAFLEAFKGAATGTPEANTGGEATPEAKAGDEAEATPEAKPEANTGGEAEAQPEAKTGGEAEATPEAKPEANTGGTQGVPPEANEAKTEPAQGGEQPGGE